MEDAISWIISEREEYKYCFYYTNPFLYSNHDNYAKLIYATRIPFGRESISKFKDEIWYKVIHKKDSFNNKITLGLFEINMLAKEWGFENGIGLNKFLVKINKDKISKTLHPPYITDIYNTKELEPHIQSITDFYQCDITEIKLTGSAGLFNEPLYKLNDLDLIIPIRTEEQLDNINKTLIPHNSTSISFKNRIWPIRWKDKSGLLICPFFIYSGLTPPIIDFERTGRKLKGRITITNSKYGIFNLPVFQCHGVTEGLIINSSFIRGFIKNGMHFDIECEEYLVTQGQWQGIKIGLIVQDPIYLDTNKLSD